MLSEIKEVVTQSKKIKDANHLQEIIEAMSAIVAGQKKENRQLRKIIDDHELSKQKFLSEELEKRTHRLKRIAFGFGREKNKLRNRERIKEQRQLTLQSKGLVELDSIPKKSDLPSAMVEHLLSEEEMLELCQNTGLEVNEGDEVECEQIHELYEESREITVTERTYTQVVHRRMKYRAMNHTTGKNKIVTAPGPVKLYPKCQFSVDFGVQSVVDKFLNFLPYERQRRELRRAGLNLPVSTFCRLEKGLSIHLESIVEGIRKDILDTPHLAVGLDETRWPILMKAESDGYFWIMCNQAGFYYRYEPTRSGSIAKELLGDFKGSVISDKFSGYYQFASKENINWGLCLAHARRDFISLQDHYPEECGEILEIMDEVFRIEHKAKNWKELASLRKIKSHPLMIQLKEILEKRAKEFLPQDAMTSAINYVLNSWVQFIAFIDDVSLPVSNNESERGLRQTVLGRKNYRGSKTIDAADQAAILFTVIETCKRAELDPKDYITYVIENNHHGRQSLTPLKLALQEKGPSKNWPQPTKDQLSL